MECRVLKQDPSWLKGNLGKCGYFMKLGIIFVSLQQGLPLSMYGNAMIPPHPQLADGPGAPLYNGLHATDPAWNPMIKVVTNSSENADPQQVRI